MRYPAADSVSWLTEQLSIHGLDDMNYCSSNWVKFEDEDRTQNPWSMP